MTEQLDFARQLRPNVIRRERQYAISTSGQDLQAALDELGIEIGEAFYVVRDLRTATEAHARRGNPDISRAVARDLTPATLRKSQRAVLRCLQHAGPVTDEEMIREYDRLRERFGWPIQSPSGLRSRRAELATAAPPLVKDTGKRRQISTSRLATVWECAYWGPLQ